MTMTMTMTMKRSFKNIAGFWGGSIVESVLHRLLICSYLACGQSVRGREVCESPPPLAHACLLFLSPITERCDN